MILGRHALIFCLTCLTLLACSESAGFHPVTPRLIPDQVRLRGTPTVRVGERFNIRGFHRLLPTDPAFPAFVLAGPLYQAPLNPLDSLELTWITLRDEKVRCVMMQRRQDYRQAHDSLSRLLNGARPVWSDSSSTAIQAVWHDGYVTLLVAGHSFPGVYPVMVTVMVAEPIGGLFNSSAPPLC